MSSDTNNKKITKIKNKDAYRRALPVSSSSRDSKIMSEDDSNIEMKRCQGPRYGNQKSLRALNVV